MSYPPLTESAKKLLAEYLAQPKTIEWREKALCEDSIWGAMREEDRKTILIRNRSAWLASICGEPVTVYTARGRTLRLELDGFPVDAIWRQLEKGEPPSRVSRALSYARSLYDSTVSQLELKGLDRPSSIREGHRRFAAAFDLAIKSRNPDHPNPQPGATVGASPVAPIPRARVAPGKPRAPKTIGDHLVDGDGEEAKLLWQLIQGSIMGPTQTFIQSRLRDLESESVLNEVFVNFRSGIHTAFQELLLNIRVSRRKPEVREARQVKREHLVLALEVLRVPVKRGWENRDVNAKAIKKAYRKMSARFHPDKNPGNELTDARYKQVQEAYQLLKEALDI